MRNIQEKAETSVYNFGKERYQEGLHRGLQVAISILQSVENKNAAAACMNIIGREIKLAGSLPEPQLILEWQPLQRGRNPGVN